VRDLRALEVTDHGRLIRLRFVANAFLHHMVRNIVGTLVYVGLGRQPAAWAADVLAARDRDLAAPTFLAAGLYFTGVDYDASFALPPAEEFSLRP
jgi:tRNA pseudouridine38-40 synthase